MSIEVTALTKRYGDQKAVNDISFIVNKSEIVGFLGPNGAGKSTTMKIITGYLQQDMGEALVCGINVKQHPIEIKRKIGYLPESNPLYPDMYVREYLDFIAGVHQLDNKKEKIENAIRLTGLTTESSKKAGQLSKGYKQRVGLAAALIHDPEVLILDEPTSGLDPNQIIEIRDVIKGLGQNKTVLFSSHILQEVEAICDRVIIINKGSLVADEKLSTLQQLKKGNSSVVVHFKEPTALAIMEKLSGAEKVEELETSKFRIQTSNPEVLKRELLEFAVRNNMNIVALQSEVSSLEDVFRLLTSVRE